MRLGFWRFFCLTVTYLSIKGIIDMKSLVLYSIEVIERINL